MAQYPANPSKVVRFGVFEVDLANAELRKNGLRIRIQEQPFQVLSILLEHPGEVVSREELVRRIWRDGTFVDFERGLNAAVTRLRQTLSDSADNPRYVETVARQGYRFSMPIAPRAATNGDAPAAAPAESDAATGGNAIPSTGAIRSRWRLRPIVFSGALLGLIALSVLVVLSSRTPKSGAGYSQLTDFTDSAIAPTLSPDGRTVAFIRGADWFLSRDQIWLKSLPDGEPVQLTYDPRLKFAPAFSPDGSQVAYSVVEPSRTAWDTVSVPARGGEPRILMANAEGLTWIGKGQLLFSEIRRGIHMAVVTAKENRSAARDVYVPEHERAMAHFSSISPDQKSVLIIEMDHTTAWQPCRLVPFDGSSRGRQVGPPGRCTSAGWSPDGNWMYFTVATQEGQHLWRQRFPAGKPERITLGPTEAQGVAMAPDGRSVITSLGMQQSAIWIHDAQGDRQISSVGNAFQPRISADGNRVFHLLRRSAPESTNDLWAVDLRTGRSDRLVWDFQITSYDISDSGSEALLAVKPTHGKSQIWLAALDRRFPPVLIASDGEDSPYFGPNGQILFTLSDGRANYLFRMNQDGSDRSKVVLHPILNVMSVSPDRLWVAALVAVNDEQARFAEIAIPVQGGTAKRICSGFCVARWAPDGKFFYVTVDPGTPSHPGNTVAIPIPAGSMLPELPSTGIRSLDEGLVLSGKPVIAQSELAPGMNPSLYAYVKTAMHRNLFRVPIP